MAMIKCKMCGGDFAVTEGHSLVGRTFFPRLPMPPDRREVDFAEFTEQKTVGDRRPGEALFKLKKRGGRLLQSRFACQLPQ